MAKIAVVGAGAGGTAAVVELVAAGHEVALWARSPQTLAPLRAQDGVAHDGVLGSGLVRPQLMTNDIGAAIADADAILVCLPSFAHADVAAAFARAGVTRPIILNPGHTGGALEFSQCFRALGATAPSIAEFSTLTYVARKYAPKKVTISGRAKSVRLAALPGGGAARAAAQMLFGAANVMPDVLACDLANVNMVLHTPGAVLGAAWIEATQGDFTFYVQGMTAGVARVMDALDAERRAVARAFGHDLPPLIVEMQAIGTADAAVHGTSDLVAAIVSGEANQRIKAPDSLAHRYYREDFGYGLLPLTVFAGIAGIAVPMAEALLRVAQALTGVDFVAHGRTAARMGIAGFDQKRLLEHLRATTHGT